MDISLSTIFFLVFLGYVLFTIIMFLWVKNTGVKWGIWGAVTGVLLTLYVVYCMVNTQQPSIANQLNAIVPGKPKQGL